jgi:hypothetical protein
VPQVHPPVEFHLGRFPKERRLLKPFLSSFDVTWADRREALGTGASFYFLKPDRPTSERYGFEREVLLVYTPFPQLEMRVIQLINRFLSQQPAQGRVESIAILLVSEDPGVRARVSEIMASSVETRSIVAFTSAELEGAAPGELVRARLAEQLFSRDLFDISQALVEDTYFFGRRQFVLDLRDRLRRSENVGLFGLRKTGKSSTISALRRTLAESDPDIKVVSLDAQDPAIYRLRWWELLNRILEEAARAGDASLPRERFHATGPDDAAARFAAGLDQLRTSGTHSRLLIVFDEFEHLCPDLSLGEHWVEDFVPLWQTIRAYQDRTRALSCLIAGVNPKFAEETRIGARDNPMFALLPRVFVPAFTLAEVRDMVRTLGRYMGLRFEETVFSYLRARYGGHPLLIRLACSWMYQHATRFEPGAPLLLTLHEFQASEKSRDASLEPYARHIMDVLTMWYPLEYEMFEMLCEGHVTDYEEMADEDPQLLEHLFGYGLLDGLKGSDPANQMIADYVKHAAGTLPRTAKGHNHEAHVQSWTAELERLADTVVHSRTYTQELAEMLRVTHIFTDDKLRLGAKLADLRVAPLSVSRLQFQQVVGILQQLTWDCMPAASRVTAKDGYPALYQACDTVRSLRHWQEHPDLTDPQVRERVITFIQAHVGGFPGAPEDWALMHIQIMRDLAAAFRDTQARLFSARKN